MLTPKSATTENNAIKAVGDIRELLILKARAP